MTHPRARSTAEWTWITLVLLVAAVFRFYDLGDIPKGLEHDEVATWHMVVGVLEGRRPIYFEEGYGHEPLFNYLTAIPMSLFGQNWLGERFWAPWLGMLTVAATYALMRRMFDPFIALSAAGFQATVLWAFFFNRLGLRLNQLPLLLCVTAYCFWRGLQSGGSRSLLTDPGQGRLASVRARDRVQQRDARWAWFAAAGALMGLCFYTYMSARIVPLIFVGFTLYVIAHHRWIARPESGSRPSWRSVVTKIWPVLSCFAVAVLVMAPLALYFVGRPPPTNIPQRENQVRAPLVALVKGDLRPILTNAWALIKMWNVDGERYWQLNYSHRPVFVEPVSGMLFWVGVLIVLWRWREPRMALLGLWIGLGMVPSLITSEAPSWPRTMLASPAALALPGIAVSTIRCWIRERDGARLAARDREVNAGPGQRGRRLMEGAIVALLMLSLSSTTALTFHDYLIVWPRHPRVRYAFQSSLTEALRYLDASADSTPVVMAGLSVHDMDSWTERSSLRRRDLNIRWVDTRSALVIPTGDAARLLTLDITPVEPTLAEWAGLHTAPVLDQGEVVPRGGMEDDVEAPLYYDPAFTVYRLDAAGLRQRIAGAQHAVYVGDSPLRASPLKEAPQFGGLVRLSGYEWLTMPTSGGTAQLLTFWTVLKRGPSSTIYGEPALRTFVHLLDGDQAFVSGVDTLGAAPDTWLAGDIVVQLHSLPFPSGRGVYEVEVGWYAPPDGPRLPIDGVDAPGRRILLDPVEVSE